MMQIQIAIKFNLAYINTIHVYMDNKSLDLCAKLSHHKILEEFNKYAFNTVHRAYSKFYRFKTLKLKEIYELTFLSAVIKKIHIIIQISNMIQPLLDNFCRIVFIVITANPIKNNSSISIFKSFFTFL